MLFDNTFALAVKEFGDRPERPSTTRSPGSGAAPPVTVGWVAMSVVGALVGRAIPEALALDFAVPIMFLAIIAPMLRTLPQLVAAFTGIVAALSLTSLPYGTGLIVASLLAMMAGAETERRMTR